MIGKRVAPAAAVGAGTVLAAYSLFVLPASAPWAPGPTPPVRVLFAGDLMLDRNVARAAEARGAEGLFATSTRALFADADVRVVNLEGTVTDNPSIAQRDSSILRFTFEPALAKRVFELLNLNAVSLANNHAYDFGKAGYEATLMNVEGGIDGGGPQAFGHPYNDPQYLTALVSVPPDFHYLCLVGYHALFDPSTTSVVAEITRLKHEDTPCWRVIVFAHWGEEYRTSSTAGQVAAAHAFVDAGADLVIGSHPHVVEPYEVYRGKAIFYSLGNFMFDQDFSWETEHGLAVRADFYPDKTTFTLTPLAIEQERSAVADGQDRERVLSGLGAVATFTLP